MEKEQSFQHVEVIHSDINTKEKKKRPKTIKLPKENTGRKLL